jgi:hypothetical protein
MRSHRIVAARWVLLAAVCACAAAQALAHPIVSTDINRHVTLTVADDRLEVRYLYEMLEIAAIEAARAWDVDGDGATSPAERDQFVASWAAELERGLQVTLDGTPVPLALDATRWELGEGAMGLKTWKVAATLTARLPVTRALGALEYRDLLRPQEVGWKEIVLLARGGSVVARASVPSQDRSYELTDYAAMLELPNPDETTASALLRFPSTLVPAQAASEQDRSIDRASRPAREPATERAAARKPAPPQPAATSGTSEAKQAAPPARAPPGQEPKPAVASESEAARPASLQSGWSHYAVPFFKLGMHHIATGLDHLLFLLGLLLFRQSLARLIAVITCFTVAHSITLAAAVAGWVTPPGHLIEVLIALSIGYVGAASLLWPVSGHGPWIALAFGLVHGFGFAGALNQALGGLGGERAWLVALAAFNLGIEALQVLAVAVAWPLLQHLDRLKRAGVLRRLLSFCVMSAGIAWGARRLIQM